MTNHLTIPHPGIIAFHVNGIADSASFRERIKTQLEALDSNKRFSIYIEVGPSSELEYQAILDSISSALKGLDKYMKLVDKVALVTDKKNLEITKRIDNRIIPATNQKVFLRKESELAKTWLKLWAVIEKK